MRDKFMKPPREKISEPKKQAATQPHPPATRSGRRQQAQVHDPDFMTPEERSSMVAHENSEEPFKRIDSSEIELPTSETPPSEDEMEFHFGSREETNAALEEKIATQNTLKLHERL